MTEYFIFRECRGEVRRRHRFLFWHYHTERWEHDSELFGAWLAGPFPDMLGAQRWSLFQPKHDRIVPSTDLHPDLVRCHVLGRANGNHAEQYYGADELREPTRLLRQLRRIWKKHACT